MGRFQLDKIQIEDYTERQELYSKNIRGKLPFTITVHQLDGGKVFQVFLYRAHPRAEEFITMALEKLYMTTQTSSFHLKEGILRLHINGQQFMINANGAIDINVIEYNFNSKEITVSDFEKGKAAVLITFRFEKETDNAKVQKELKDLNMEE